LKKKIILFYPSRSSFVKKDIEILSEKYSVVESDFNVQQKALTPFFLIGQMFFLLKNIWQADLVICEFASYHSLLPTVFAKLCKKPSLVVIGGTDAVSFPSIHYGNFSKRTMAFFTKWSLKWASHIAPKHEALVYSDYSYQDADFKKQGYKFFIPDIRTPYTVIHNGYNSEFWNRKKEKIKNRFITVASGINRGFVRRLKGIDLITEVAPFFPECEFVIIGVPENYDLGESSKNIVKIPFVENSKLPEYYSEAEFYLQLSMSEGFPNALCEAMLCECIPVVSNVSSMPEIVGDSGFILLKRDVNMLKETIAKALESDRRTLAAKARNRIAQNYPVQKRRDQLLSLTEVLMNKGH